MASAFIIYIQPQLQRDPNEEAAALLRVLLYKTDNTTFGGDVPEVPQWTGPPRTTVVAQILLYLSLSLIFSSVLQIILAKQLLNLYLLAGTRELMIERILGRQREPKWFTTGLHIVILLLAISLQVALLLISCAITIYLWKINLAIAAVVLVAVLTTVSACALFVVLGSANSALTYIVEGPRRR